MKRLFRWFLHPPVTGPSAILLMRLMSGIVFLWDGTLRMVFFKHEMEWFPNKSFSIHDIAAHLVPVGEITGGLLLVLGLFTRITAAYFMVQMLVALFGSKINFHPGSFAMSAGSGTPDFWTLWYEVQPEYVQMLSCLFLMLEGAGRLSVDFIISTSRKIYRICEK